jgi:glycosyltransferase involved in cell wall biosynthesis
LLIITRWLPNQARPGTGIFTKNIIEAQRELGKYQITIVSPVPQYPFIPLQILKKYHPFSQLPYHESYLNCPMFRPRYFKFPDPLFKSIDMRGYLSAVKKVIDRENLSFDIIHSHGLYPDSYVAGLIGKMYAVPVVMHVHDSSLRKNRLKNIHKKIMRLATALIPVSRYQFKHIVDIDPFLKERCAVIHNGINTGNISYKENSVKINNYKKLVFVGNLIPIKGVDILLQAMKLLKRKNIKLDIIGTGSKKNEYNEYVKRNNLTDSVTFLDQVDNKIVCSKLHEYDFFVLPSRYETFGVAIIESLAAGVPVIASDICAIPEIISDNKLGILFKPNDHIDLAQSIQKAIEMKWDRKYCRKKAKQYSLKITANKIDKIYESCS